MKKTTKKMEAPVVPAKVEAKEIAPKKKAPKKAAAQKAAAPEPTPAPVEPTPVPAAKKSAPKKSAAPKKAAPAPIKLSASQSELLTKVGGTAEAGYTVEKKVEQRTIDILLEKKLLKKGAKDKVTGKIKYHVTSTGKKLTS